MIGNDIVDFAQAAKDSNWRRRGWLDKIFVPEEQELIANAMNPDCMVWLLWSMKEAAYKAHQRVERHLPRYNPKSFVCALKTLGTHNSGQAESAGVVKVDKHCYQTKSTITSSYVHTIASLTIFSNKGISKTIKNPNTETIFDQLQSNLPQSNSNNYKLQKDALGIPQIFDGDCQTSFLISISHHGRFGGCFLRT